MENVLRKRASAHTRKRFCRKRSPLIQKLPFEEIRDTVDLSHREDVEALCDRIVFQRQLRKMPQALREIFEQVKTHSLRQVAQSLAMPVYEIKKLLQQGQRYFDSREGFDFLGRAQWRFL